MQLVNTTIKIPFIRCKLLDSGYMIEPVQGFSSLTFAALGLKALTRLTFQHQENRLVTKLILNDHTHTATTASSIATAHWVKMFVQCVGETHHVESSQVVGG